MVLVQLCGMLRVFLLPVQRIIRYGRIQQSAFAVHNRDTHAKRSEIHSRNDCHLRL